MYQVPKTRFPTQLASLVHLLQMQEFLDQLVRKLSLRQRMKGDLWLHFCTSRPS